MCGEDTETGKKEMIKGGRNEIKEENK